MASGRPDVRLNAIPLLFLIFFFSFVFISCKIAVFF